MLLPVTLLRHRPVKSMNPTGVMYARPMWNWSGESGLSSGDAGAVAGATGAGAPGATAVGAGAAGGGAGCASAGPAASSASEVNKTTEWFVMTCAHLHRTPWRTGDGAATHK
jgi:hypothetical protein